MYLYICKCLIFKNIFSMKNLSNTLIAIFIMAIVFVSCSQEQDSMSGPLENLYSEMFTLKARYQGIQYDVLCGLIEGDSIKNDSIVFLSNPAFQAIYTSEISNLPNLVTYINNDGFIEYFDTKEAILRSGKIGSAIIQTIYRR